MILGRNCLTGQRSTPTMKQMSEEVTHQPTGYRRPSAVRRFFAIGLCHLSDKRSPSQTIESGYVEDTD